MGYIRHHAIVVTSWNIEAIQKAWIKAKELFPKITPLTDQGINSYRSFLIPPDGSKEGWDSSNEGDRNRETFKDFCDTFDYGDGSNPISWVEVQFGDEDLVTKIIDDSDADRRRVITA